MIKKELRARRAAVYSEKYQFPWLAVSVQFTEIIVAGVSPIPLRKKAPRRDWTTVETDGALMRERCYEVLTGPLEIENSGVEPLSAKERVKYEGPAADRQKGLFLLSQEKRRARVRRGRPGDPSKACNVVRRDTLCGGEQWRAVGFGFGAFEF